MGSQVILSDSSKESNIYLCCPQTFNSQPQRHAGHSKWQNIRHIKADKDAQKGKMAQYIVKKMNIAIAGKIVSRNTTL